MLHRFCYAPSHSDGELTRLSWSTFAAFCRYQQGLQSLALGFEVPAVDFCKKASHLINRAASPRQMLAADTVLKTAIDDLRSALEIIFSPSALEAPQSATAISQYIPFSSSSPPNSPPTKSLSGSRNEGSNVSTDHGKRPRTSLPKLKMPAKGAGGKVRAPSEVRSRKKLSVAP